MDAILDLPMGVVVEGLAVDPQTKEALDGPKRGENTYLSPVYNLMVARAAGDWENLSRAPRN